MCGGLRTFTVLKLNLCSLTFQTGSHGIPSLLSFVFDSVTLLQLVLTVVIWAVLVNHTTQ